MKKFDIYLASAMIFIALVWFLFNNIFSEKAETVNVYRNNELIISSSLNSDDDISVMDGTSELMHISINGGVVDVTSASCPDKLCVHQIPISKRNDTIACLPNKIIVVVENNSTDLEPVTDAVTY